MELPSFLHWVDLLFEPKVCPKAVKAPKKAKKKGRSIFRTRAESQELKKRIIELNKQGLKSEAISEEVGVSRAYAALILQKYRKGLLDPDKIRVRAGVGVPYAKGPPDEQERAKLVETLRGTPEEAGFAGEKVWSTKLAKTWYRQNLGRMITIGDLEEIVTTENLPVPLNWRYEVGGAAFPDESPVKRGRPPGKRAKPRVLKISDASSVDDLIRALDIDPATAKELMANVFPDTAAKIKAEAATPKAKTKGAQTVKPPSGPAPEGVKLGRNDACPEGIGLKFKQCCGRRGLKTCDGLGAKG